VWDGTGSSVFEMIVKVPFDDRPPTLTLTSDYTSEKLEMYLKSGAVNQYQTSFNGARCEFEVKRSKEDEIEVYSSSLQNCGSTADYYVYSDFTLPMKIKLNGTFVPQTDVTGISRKYTGLSSNYQGPNVTINRATMMKEDTWLKGIEFNLFLDEQGGQKDICNTLEWKYIII
jgi:hypothetical protein